MIESLVHLDQEVLVAVNQFTGNYFLDKLMVLVSAKWVWIPFYAFILFTFYKQFGLKNAVWILAGGLGMLVLTDQGSVQLFKEIFQRPRPCHNPELLTELFLPSGKCGGRFGFISSHASNVFGLAALVVMLLGRAKKAWLLIFIWAGIVAFSRVFLAVHYPADVIGGAIFGSIVGFAVGYISRNQLKLA